MLCTEYSVHTYNPVANRHHATTIGLKSRLKEHGGGWQGGPFEHTAPLITKGGSIQYECECENVMARIDRISLCMYGMAYGVLRKVRISDIMVAISNGSIPVGRTNCYVRSTKVRSTEYRIQTKWMLKFDTSEAGGIAPR